MKDLWQELDIDSDRAPMFDEYGVPCLVKSGGIWDRSLDDILAKFSMCPPLAVVDDGKHRFALWRVDLLSERIPLHDDSMDGAELSDDERRKMQELIYLITDNFKGPIHLPESAKVLQFNPRARWLDGFWLRQLANLHRCYGGARVSELIADGKANYDDVVGGLEVGDVGIIGGPAGSGKTYLGCDIALSVANGEAALGGLLEVPSAGNVALICLEETFKQIAGRLSAIAKRRQLSGDAIEIFDRDQFIGPNGRDMTRREKQRRIVEICERLQFPRLAIVDNLKEIIDGSETDDQAVADVMMVLREIARVNRCALLLAHHTNEASVKGGARELLKATALRGHSNFNAFARWQFHVAPQKISGGMGLLVKLVKVNHAEEWSKAQALTMTMDASGGPAGFALPDASNAAAPEADHSLHAVVAAVAAVNPPRGKRETADQIRNVLGVSRAAAEKLIDQALRKKLLVAATMEGSRAVAIKAVELDQLDQLDRPDPPPAGQVAPEQMPHIQRLTSR